MLSMASHARPDDATLLTSSPITRPTCLATEACRPHTAEVWTSREGWQSFCSCDHIPILTSVTEPMRCMQAVFTVLPVRFARAVAALVRPNRNGGLQGDQLFDLLCVLIFAATLSFLRLLPAGTIYFWLKDLTQEFLKLHVVHSAVEIFDKVNSALLPLPALCLCLESALTVQQCLRGVGLCAPAGEQGLGFRIRRHQRRV